MDLRQLECFLEVKEQLHFRRAAERLYLAQPTVSEAIRRLEIELGGPLFERTSRRVTLTPLGEAFAVDARLAYDAVTDAYGRGKTMAARQANQLLVGHPNDYLALVDAVVALQKANPGLLVTIRSMTSPQLLDALRDRRLHVAVAWEPEPDPMLDQADLDLCPLFAVTPARHLIARRASTTLAELAGEPLIAWPRSANPRTYDLLVDAMDRTGLPWSLVGRASGLDNVVSRVRSGFGVALVYGSPADAVKDVAFVPVDDDRLALRRRIIWRRDERHPAVRQLVAMLTT